MPYPLPLTRTEAYLAYKAGVIQQSDLKPSLAVPRNGIDAWLAYWTGLAADYPKREGGTPHILQEEEAYIAYLSGVINEYPEKCLRRVGAYLRYLISARWGRPDHPLNREELYLSLIKTQFIPSGDPSSDIKIDGTAKAPFVDVEMYGDTTQQTYSGVQVVKKQGFATPASDTDFWTVFNATQSDISNDGFSTFTFSGTGFKNFFIKRAGSDIKASTTYTIIVELDKVTDLGYLVITQNNTGSDSFPDFTVISLPDGATTSASGNATNGAIQNIPAGVGGNIVLLGTTRDELKTQTLRFYASGASSDGKKIRARVSIIEGDHSSDWQNYSGDNWQPYVGGVPSPNPDYPQAVNTVTGRQTVEVTGKNLFNLNGDQQPNTRCTGTINGQSITITSTANSTGFYSIVIPNSSELLGKTVTLSVGDIAASSDVETTGRILIYQAVSTQPNSVGANISGVDIRSAGSTTFTFPDSFQSGRDCFAVVLYANARGTSTVVGEYLTYTNIQLELGSTGTDYEPYSSNDYEINLGKNLYQSIAVTTPSGGLTSEVLPDGRVRIHGKATSNSSNFLGYMSTNLPAGTYTFSITGELPFRLLLRSDDAQNHWVLNAGQTKITQTISNTLNTIWVWGYQLVSGTDYDITIGIQLEEGSTATPFAPYFVPIELCKIGDYQDYIYKDEGEWKIHKATKAVTLDGSEQWTVFGQDFRNTDVSVWGDLASAELDNMAVSNSFIYWKNTGNISTTMPNYNFGWRANKESIDFRYDALNLDVNSWTSWLEEHNIKVYYALATAVETTITNTNLIAQLDALVNGGAEDGTTYIKVSAADPNLPGLLYVEAPKYE